jgi:hypothetical protein
MTDDAETTRLLNDQAIGQALSEGGCGLARVGLERIRRETGVHYADIIERVLETTDRSPIGLRMLFPDRFGPEPVITQRHCGFVDITPTPCNVTIDIYGEEFHFKASADEARRLIKTFERVLAARRSVRRLQGELDAARAQSFDGVAVGAGAGIVVDDPDAGGKSEAA